MLSMTALLAAGLGLYAYAETIIWVRDAVKQGDPLYASAEIPVGRGVFTVKIADRAEGAQVNARVVGPYNIEAASAVIDTPTHKGEFAVRERYSHPCSPEGLVCPQAFIIGDQHEFTLIVESNSAYSTNVVAMLGSSGLGDFRTGLGDAALYVLAVGAVGMAASTADIVIRRRRHV